MMQMFFEDRIFLPERNFEVMFFDAWIEKETKGSDEGQGNFLEDSSQKIVTDFLVQSPSTEEYSLMEAFEIKKSFPKKLDWTLVKKPLAIDRLHRLRRGSHLFKNVKKVSLVLEAVYLSFYTKRTVFGAKFKFILAQVKSGLSELQDLTTSLHDTVAAYRTFATRLRQSDLDIIGRKEDKSKGYSFDDSDFFFANTVWPNFVRSEQAWTTLLEAYVIAVEERAIVPLQEMTRKLSNQQNLIVKNGQKWFTQIETTKVEVEDLKKKAEDAEANVEVCKFNLEIIRSRDNSEKPVDEVGESTHPLEVVSKSSTRQQRKLQKRLVILIGTGEKFRLDFAEKVASLNRELINFTESLTEIFRDYLRLERRRIGRLQRILSTVVELKSDFLQNLQNSVKESLKGALMLFSSERKVELENSHSLDGRKKHNIRLISDEHDKNLAVLLKADNVVLDESMFCIQDHSFYYPLLGNDTYLDLFCTYLGPIALKNNSNDIEFMEADFGCWIAHLKQARKVYKRLQERAEVKAQSLLILGRYMLHLLPPSDVEKPQKLKGPRLTKNGMKSTTVNANSVVDGPDACSIKQDLPQNEGCSSVTAAILSLKRNFGRFGSTLANDGVLSVRRDLGGLSKEVWGVLKTSSRRERNKKSASKKRLAVISKATEKARSHLDKESATLAQMLEDMRACRTESSTGTSSRSFVESQQDKEVFRSETTEIDKPPFNEDEDTKNIISEVLSEMVESIVTENVKEKSIRPEDLLLDPDLQIAAENVSTSSTSRRDSPSTSSMRKSFPLKTLRTRMSLPLNTETGSRSERRFVKLKQRVESFMKDKDVAETQLAACQSNEQEAKQQYLDQISKSFLVFRFEEALRLVGTVRLLNRYYTSFDSIFSAARLDFEQTRSIIEQIDVDADLSANSKLNLRMENFTKMALKVLHRRSSHQVEGDIDADRRTDTMSSFGEADEPSFASFGEANFGSCDLSSSDDNYSQLGFATNMFDSFPAVIKFFGEVQLELSKLQAFLSGHSNAFHSASSSMMKVTRSMDTSKVLCHGCSFRSNRRHRKDVSKKSQFDGLQEIFSRLNDASTKAHLLYQKLDFQSNELTTKTWLLSQEVGRVLSVHESRKKSLDLSLNRVQQKFQSSKERLEALEIKLDHAERELVELGVSDQKKRQHFACFGADSPGMVDRRFVFGLRDQKENEYREVCEAEKEVFRVKGTYEDCMSQILHRLQSNLEDYLHSFILIWHGFLRIITAYVEETLVKSNPFLSMVTDNLISTDYSETDSIQEKDSTSAEKFLSAGFSKNSSVILKSIISDFEASEALCSKCEVIQAKRLEIESKLAADLLNYAEKSQFFKKKPGGRMMSESSSSLCRCVLDTLFFHNRIATVKLENCKNKTAELLAQIRALSRSLKKKLEDVKRLLKRVEKITNSSSGELRSAGKNLEKRKLLLEKSPHTESLLVTKARKAKLDSALIRFKRAKENIQTIEADVSASVKSALALQKEFHLEKDSTSSELLKILREKDKKTGVELRELCSKAWDKAQEVVPIGDVQVFIENYGKMPVRATPSDTFSETG